MKLKRILLAAAAASVLSGGAAVADSTGITDTSIKIGNTNPYSGPASAYSVIGKAISAYFKELNTKAASTAARLSSFPWMTATARRAPCSRFVSWSKKRKIAFLFQSLGTPTNSAIHKYMNQKKVPQLFVATGASKWGQPEKVSLDDGLPAHL